MSLLGSKMTPPLKVETLIERDRLAQYVTQSADRQLALIRTPPGYGKTSLLCQWHRALQAQGYPACWLTLHSDDRDPETVLQYLAAALSIQLEKNSARNESAPPPDNGKLINSIVATIETYGAPVFFLLDDVHLLAPLAIDALSQLIDRLPSQAHFIVTARAVPNLRVARTRARNSLLELSARDLKFTLRETLRFLQGSVELNESELALLDHRIEGWPTGLRLFLDALQKSPTSPRELIAAFTGSRRSVSDFFSEEVFASLALETKKFLLTTSILDELTPSLCNAVTNHRDGQQHLDSIESAGLFLIPLDEERRRYRYHPLFAEFLQRQLKDADPMAPTDLFDRASRWLWANGDYEKAIDYALRGRSFEYAAELLELRCQDMVYHGKFQLLNQFCAQMPQALLQNYPRVLLVQAWLATRNLRFNESQQLVASARTRVAYLESTNTASPHDLRELHYLILHREMMLAAAQDNASQVEELCQNLLDEFPEEQHPYLSGTVYSQLLYSRRERYKLIDLERLQAMAQGILNRSEFSLASIALQASVGPSLFFAGRTDAAVRALEQSLEAAIRFGGRNSSLAALPALPLAEIAYEANDLQRAQELVESTLPYVGEFGFVDQLMPGYLTLARIRRAQDDLSGAFQALEDGLSLATERNLERLRIALVGEYVKFLIHSGRPDQAIRYARGAGALGPVQSLLPSGSSTTRDELRALVSVRIALSEDHIADGLNIAKHWRRQSASNGAIRSLIRWDTMLAQLHFVSGDARAAQRALREAMTHAANSRILRSFIDEGPTVRTLLLAARAATDVEGRHPTDAFATELLNAFESADSSTSPAPRQSQSVAGEGLYGKLSLREREILALVGSGMRNREVAQKLGMTEGSVKWYMQQVYDKVGTRRRLQAVERARQFGLII
jgi:LuxR family maltose regulon positive regulatory protein